MQPHLQHHCARHKKPRSVRVHSPTSASAGTALGSLTAGMPACTRPASWAMAAEEGAPACAARHGTLGLGAWRAHTPQGKCCSRPLTSCAGTPPGQHGGRRVAGSLTGGLQMRRHAARAPRRSSTCEGFRVVGPAGQQLAGMCAWHRSKAAHLGTMHAGRRRAGRAPQRQGCGRTPAQAAAAGPQGRRCCAASGFPGPCTPPGGQGPGPGLGFRTWLGLPPG